MRFSVQEGAGMRFAIGQILSVTHSGMMSDMRPRLRECTFQHIYRRLPKYCTSMKKVAHISFIYGLRKEINIYGKTAHKPLFYLSAMYTCIPMGLHYLVLCRQYWPLLHACNF